MRWHVLNFWHLLLLINAHAIEIKSLANDSLGLQSHKKMGSKCCTICLQFFQQALVKHIRIYIQHSTYTENMV